MYFYFFSVILVFFGVEGCKIIDRGLIKVFEFFLNLEEFDLGLNFIIDVGIK